MALQLELNVGSRSEDIVQGEGVDPDLSIVQVGKHQAKVHEFLFQAEPLVRLLIIDILLGFGPHYIGQLDIYRTGFVLIDVEHLLG